MIVLEPLYHRDHLCVAIRGGFQGAALEAIRRFPGRKFSITNGCWYIGYNSEQLLALKGVLDKLDQVKVEGILLVTGSWLLVIGC